MTFNSQQKNNYINPDVLTIDDLTSEHMHLIADRCGVNAAVSLMQHMPGIELYIPAAGKKIMELQYIRSNYNGHNTASIAIHLGITRKKVELLSKSKIEYSKPIFSNKHIFTIAQRCGHEIAKKLLEAFPRQRFYIPCDGFSHVRRSFIIKNFNGSNVIELALQCGVSERYVRSIIADMYASKAQLSLFDTATF